jgi:hypothetical protein
MIALIAGMVFTAATSVAMPAQFNSRIVGMNARAGVVYARNNTTGKTFFFAPKDKNMFAALKVGTPVNFARRGGVSVQGFPGAVFKPMRVPKGAGPKPLKVDIDCSITPEVCPGTKPGQNKLTMDGATTWQDVIDYCYDEMDNCIGGPM